MPKELVVAHKTGDIGFFEHDGGIVFTPWGDYIFVAFSESNLPDAAGERIAKLSERGPKDITQFQKVLSPILNQSKSKPIV